MERLVLCLFALGFLALVAGRAESAEGEYPTVASAGFHHCALIYQRESRNTEELKPYVARYVNGKPTSDWLFDSYLFLTQTTASDKSTESGATDKRDWLSILDQWFASGRDLFALDDALTETAEAQGLPGPPSKRKIILCIPWLNPKVTSFGDVDGDGRSEDLSTAEGRKTVIRWYLGEARRRFADARFRHLELWGFYCMREDVIHDADTISMIVEEVHSKSEKVLWIPYFLASGWDQWRKFGIDVAIMQPNYAFSSWMDGGRARRNRLAICADLARSHGLGVEIETRGTASSDFERRMFMHYLCDGAKSRYGYQDAPTAYFLTYDAIGAWYNAADAKSRKTYDALCDYVVGKPVKDPDVEYEWKWSKSKDALVAATVLPSRQYIASLDVFLRDSPADYWHGIASVEVRADKSTSWTPCGSKIRDTADSIAGDHQVITVPVGSSAEEVRLIFKSEPGSSTLCVTRIATNPEGSLPLKHSR
ncbi:MAG TPA: DUF4855 domain-containing protein [Armatimonadota bacterium]|jgi:hypothetical protein